MTGQFQFCSEQAENTFGDICVTKKNNFQLHTSSNPLMKMKIGVVFSAWVKVKTAIRASISGYRAWRRLRLEQRISRDSFRHLLSLDDSVLNDIGVNREDVIWASKLPVSENAAVALDRKSKKSRSESCMQIK